MFRLPSMEGLEGNLWMWLLVVTILLMLTPIVLCKSVIVCF